MVFLGWFMAVPKEFKIVVSKKFRVAFLAVYIPIKMLKTFYLSIT